MKQFTTMENERDNIAIVVRFCEALERLKQDKCIGGLKTFTERYGINRWNFISLRKDPEECHGRFRSSWIAYIVRDYHINPYWLLLGEGDFYAPGFSAEIVKKLQEDCSRKKSTA